MDKKVLKFYEAPISELIEMEAEGFMCTSPNNPDNPFDGNTGEPEEV